MKYAQRPGNQNPAILDTPLQIKLTPAQHAALMDSARRHETTAAEIMRHAIAALLSQFDQQVERENAAA